MIKKANVKNNVTLYLQHLLSLKEGERACAAEAAERLAYYRHERLVHLVVTMTVIVCAVVLIMGGVFAQGLSAVLLSAAGLIAFALSGFYLRHYFFLENSIQLISEIVIEQLTADSFGASTAR